MAKESREKSRNLQTIASKHVKKRFRTICGDPLNSKELLRLYRAGKSEAAAAIFDRYVARLIALARSRIGLKLRRRVDAEDVVQSAYRSFFAHARNDEYELANSGDLWRLLASITLHKLHGQIEQQTAGKRSVDREEPLDLALENAEAPEPSAAEVVALVEELQLSLEKLTLGERLILTLTLQGQSIQQIGCAIGKSERTARRLLAEIQRKLEQRLLGKSSYVPLLRRSAEEPHAPLLFSDYVLEQMLGAGGMGRVFRAREKNTGKRVAIKSLHKSRQSDERAVAQFVQEAQILAKLRHPNIVGMHGLGRFPGGGYFIVMDFVDGKDLQSRLHGGPLALGEVARIVIEVAKAIQYAHDQGVVHCDLKPGNVVLDKNGHVSVTDFGFAFLIAGSSETIPQGIGGTAGYIAPEMFQHQSRPTPAVDVYALGMILWALATAKLPDDLNQQSAMDEPLALLYSICNRCTAREPNERHQSPNDLIHDLERLGENSKS